jgi:hypothetical protein
LSGCRIGGYMTWRKLCFLAAVSIPLTTAAPTTVEFHKDIEPLLQAHCHLTYALR